MALIERWSAQDSRDGKAFKVTGPVQMAQLDDEIAAVHGWTNAGLVIEGDLDSASAETPVLLVVTHANVDPAKVTAVGKEHVPDPDYHPVVQAPETTFADVVAKATRNQWLDEIEMQVAIRGLLTGERP